MSQINYNYEIILKLLREKMHLRALAQSLDTNPMTISRKLKELETQNILDHRTEGKNKIYYLKNTLESRTAIFQAEHYKLARLLETYPNIKRTVNNIIKEKDIRLAVLFGSYAKFTAKKESDIDVYIETEEKKIKDRLELKDSKLSIKIGLYDPRNLLIKEIEKNHVILKGVEEYYEKRRFFENDEA